MPLLCQRLPIVFVCLWCHPLCANKTSCLPVWRAACADADAHYEYCDHLASPHFHSRRLVTRAELESRRVRVSLRLLCCPGENMSGSYEQAEIRQSHMKLTHGMSRTCDLSGIGTNTQVDPCNYCTITADGALATPAGHAC